MDIVEIVRKHVEERYYDKNSSKKVNMYDTHVKYVVEYAKQLAEKLNADKEIVEISALLHDISRLDGVNEKHHIGGSKYAEEFLRKHNYNEEKIKEVMHCILTHRGNTSIPRESIEAECLASADAMAHFRNIADMFHFVYGELGKSSDEGKEMIKEKLERSFQKMIPEAQDIIRDKYNAAMKILE